MAAHENLHPEQFPDPHIRHGEPGYSERAGASAKEYRENRDTRQAFDKIISHNYPPEVFAPGYMPSQ